MPDCLRNLPRNREVSPVPRETGGTQHVGTKRLCLVLVWTHSTPPRSEVSVPRPATESQTRLILLQFIYFFFPSSSLMLLPQNPPGDAIPPSQHGRGVAACSRSPMPEERHLLHLLSTGLESVKQGCAYHGERNGKPLSQVHQSISHPRHTFRNQPPNHKARWQFLHPAIGKDSRKPSAPLRIGKVLIIVLGL